MAPLDRLRFYRGAAHLHALGPRAVAELLMELAQSRGDAARILDRLARYRRLTPAMVRAAGGDRCPPRPVHLAAELAARRKRLTPGQTAKLMQITAALRDRGLT